VLALHFQHFAFSANKASLPALSLAPTTGNSPQRPVLGVSRPSTLRRTTPVLFSLSVRAMAFTALGLVPYATEGFGYPHLTALAFACAGSVSMKVQDTRCGKEQPAITGTLRCVDEHHATQSWVFQTHSQDTPDTSIPSSKFGKYRSTNSKPFQLGYVW
jgi:hypothetical protein